MTTDNQLPILNADSVGSSASEHGSGDCDSGYPRSPGDDRQRATPSSILPPPEQVLSTLRGDGSRRWIHPRLAAGQLWRRRRTVAYVLMVVFVAVPHIRIPLQGTSKPLILLDIAQREFTVFGKTFLPTDTLLLALLMLCVFITIVLVTAVTGRAWCGWACPQTVYMEFLFRPIDRLFFGKVGKGGPPRGQLPTWRRVARFATYIVLAMFLAHTFLAYFVPAERLATWVRTSPAEHPTAFAVMAATTGLILFDFLFFREQLCTIACPYGRFQSVMLDAQSLIVGYDSQRGEPRKKGKRPGGEEVGDCVDCNQCVVVCPTGIDIRNGLQMECIHCTQCIDACDRVMHRVGLEPGLIRFSSQDALSGKPPRALRVRTIIYPVLLLALLSGLVYAVSTKSAFDVQVIRGKGATFTVLDSGLVSNHFAVLLVNRSREEQTYTLGLFDHEQRFGEQIEVEVIDPSALTIGVGGAQRVAVEIRFPKSITVDDGNEPIQVEVRDTAGNVGLARCRLLGPR